MLKILKKLIFLIILSSSFSLYGMNEPKKEYSLDIQNPKTDPSTLEILWGEPGKDALYAGMWSFHLSILIDEYTNENWQHDLLGLSYKGFIVATFNNSFGERCYVAAAHRSINKKDLGNGFSTDFGYNLGVIKGYDSRLISFANQLPILPLLQLTYDVSWKMIGIQFSYVAVVLTAGFFVSYEF